MPVKTASASIGIHVPFQRLRRFVHESLGTKGGLSLPWQFFAFFVAVILLVSRDFSLFRHSQFYAEDGTVWYAQAYNIGWLHSLTLPAGGYLNTVQRLVAGLALLVPFRWAPLSMAVGGLLIQALPVPLLLSDRCRNWGTLSLRLAFAAAYVAIPNTREIYLVCTNSQWHLALALLLVAFGVIPDSMPQKIVDLGIIGVSAVSGPFPILSLPLVAVFWAARRQRWTLLVLGILAAGSTVQVLYIIHNQRQGSCGALGATPALFAQLLGGNAFLGALFGSRLAWGMVLPLACSVAALLAGLGICGYCARFTSVEVRLFFVYCFLIFAAGMRSPLVCSATHTQWGTLVTVSGQRYSFFPALALLFAILWCAGFAPSIVMRITGAILVLILCLGIHRDWKISPLPYMSFSEHAKAFNAAPPGSHVIIPVYCGGTCGMELIKKSR